MTPSFHTMIESCRLTSRHSTLSQRSELQRSLTVPDFRMTSRAVHTSSLSGNSYRSVIHAHHRKARDSAEHT